jgi:hypothetical protein
MLNVFMKMKRVFPTIVFILISAAFWGGGCSKSSSPEPAKLFQLSSQKIAGFNDGKRIRSESRTPAAEFSFTTPVDRASVPASFTFKNATGGDIPFNASYKNNDSTVVIQPTAALASLTEFTISVSTALKAKSNASLQIGSSLKFMSPIDSTDKFPVISDNALLTLVQQQHFKYFWDFGHPVSGLARERNTSGETVTSGGTGFGIMSLVVGIERGFVTRAEGLARMQKIVGFLKNNAQRFHGAYSHWLNGTTGVVQPFSAKDDGADLVETSYLMAGLLTARQYFSLANTDETTLRNDINALWQAVEWSWFRKSNENVLYWHWSPNYAWDMNHPVRGWNECLITYVLAASSPTHSIPKIVYDNGWAKNGGIANGNGYAGQILPLGEPYGGPLFFAHYSFLGINPQSLTDAYANYFTQNRAHSLIHYNYCKNNTTWYGYSESNWGLTASDDIAGYKAHSPTNDNGVISPTAALSSFPYTPDESMKALKFFYYKMGDKLWGPYGFYDAFSLHEPWFASSTLAIDQGPIIVMIENYRSELIWDLFMSCPEVKTGMTNLGFASPNL